MDNKIKDNIDVDIDIDIDIKNNMKIKVNIICNTCLCIIMNDIHCFKDKYFCSFKCRFNKIVK